MRMNIEEYKKLEAEAKDEKLFKSILNLFKKPEEIIQRDFSIYIRENYPNVIFFSDGSGIFMPKVIAMKFSILKSSKSIPDMFISEARGGYFGLYIELKDGKDKIYGKNGKTLKNKHIKAQFEMSDKLNNKNYASVFCYSTSHAIDVFNDYMKMKPTKDYLSK